MGEQKIHNEHKKNKVLYTAGILFVTLLFYSLITYPQVLFNDEEFGWLLQHNLLFSPVFLMFVLKGVYAILPCLLYLFIVQHLRFEEEGALLIALVFGSSLLIHFLFLHPISLLQLKTWGNEGLSLIATFFALGCTGALYKFEKDGDGKYLVFCILALPLAYFISPLLSFILLLPSSVFLAKEDIATSYGIYALLPLFFFLSFIPQGITNAFVLSLFVFLVFVIVRFAVKERIKTLVQFLIAAIMLTSFALSIQYGFQHEDLAFSQHEIKAIANVNRCNELFLFDYYNATKFYMALNKQQLPIHLLNASVLFSPTKPEKCVLISSRMLDEKFADEPRVFRFYKEEKTGGSDFVFFYNEGYLLRAMMDNGLFVPKDLVLMDRKSGQVSSIPFTSVQFIFSDNYKSEFARLINLNALQRPTYLEQLLNDGIVVYNESGVLLIRMPE